MGSLSTKITGTINHDDGRVETFEGDISKSNTSEVYRVSMSLDASNALVNIWNNGVGGAKGAGGIGTHGAKFILVRNIGKIPIETSELYTDWTDADPNAEVGDEYVSRIINAGDYLIFPGERAVVFPNSNSAGNSGSVHTDEDTGGIPTANTTTDDSGYVKTTTFFGLPDTGGIVPGSIAIAFYDAGYQELGMNNTTNKKGYQTYDTDTKLTTSTTYQLMVQVDGGVAQNITLIVDASNTKWGGSNGVITKINDGMRSVWEAGNFTSLPTCDIVDGDIRFTSGSRLTTSAIVLSDSTGGDTDFWGAGIIPVIGNIEPSVDSSATDFSKATHPIDDMLLDNGDGTGSRVNGGSFKYQEKDEGRLVGDIYKEGGTFELLNCPPLANYKIWATYQSAHSGVSDATTPGENTLTKLYARSMNIRRDGLVEVIVVN